MGIKVSGCYFGYKPSSLFNIYGYLYNFLVISNIKGIAGSGWHVPLIGDRNFLESAGEYIDGVGNGGGACKSTGYTYWFSPNTGATNSLGFNGIGAGLRYSGEFSGYKHYGEFWLDISSGLDAYSFELLRTQSVIFELLSSQQSGYSIRLVKDSTTLLPGQNGTYTGNDGKIYPTIAIQNELFVREWMSTNLAETKYNDLSNITYAQDELLWTSNTTGAYCSHPDWV